MSRWTREELNRSLSRYIELHSAERDILLRALDGETPAEIAKARDVTLTTLRGQVKTMCHRLRARNLAELVRRILHDTVRSLVAELDAAGIEHHE